MQLNYYLNKKNVFVDTKENCQQQQQQRICLKDTVDRQCQSQIVLAAFSPPSFDTQQHTKRLFAHCSSIRVLHLPKTKKNEKNIQKNCGPSLILVRCVPKQLKLESATASARELHFVPSIYSDYKMIIIMIMQIAHIRPESEYHRFFRSRRSQEEKILYN